MRVAFRLKASRIKTVFDVQTIVERYLYQSLDKTANGLSCEGLDGLDSNKSYLFLSNHRDIVLDPAICNVLLHSAERQTARIAIGDNLLSRPYAEQLMRVNKSFIVKRSVENRRQRLVELKRLSSYIRESIADQHSIWIAHREGRAKDGMDRTEAALIKMLMLSADKASSFEQNLSELHIVPVAISYEWDPCDTMKATELGHKALHGQYTKAEGEDIKSIAQGIQGFKGRIHLQFGTELPSDLDSADAVAEEVDRQIINMYKLHASNLAAYKMLNGELPGNLSADVDLSVAEAELKKRLGTLDASLRPFLLDGYANPVKSWLDFQVTPTCEEKGELTTVLG